ncbi:Neuronal Acetylcholine Receptor Subunit Alpha-6 [Manis pentadactyla]|nr:Neuronal Acetylcholine Receptor Subunit Alpha-6 [Manis pentadactyla]
MAAIMIEICCTIGYGSARGNRRGDRLVGGHAVTFTVAGVPALGPCQPGLFHVLGEVLFLFSVLRVHSQVSPPQLFSGSPSEILFFAPFTHHNFPQKEKKNTVLKKKKN